MKGLKVVILYYIYYYSIREEMKHRDCETNIAFISCHQGILCDISAFDITGSLLIIH